MLLLSFQGWNLEETFFDCLDGRSLLEHGIGLSFSDMVQQTCRNHRIHFFPHYKIIVQTDRKRINHCVNTVQIQINLECFKQKIYITWPLSDRIRPG